MASKGSIRRSHSLSDIRDVCIPSIENIRKNEEKTEITDCTGNKEIAVLLEILNDKNGATSSRSKEAKTAVTFRSHNEDTKVLLTDSQDGRHKSSGKPKEKPSRKSYRLKRRATLADLTCIDILNPIPETEEEETEFSVASVGNWTGQRQFSEDHSKTNRNKIDLQLGDVDHEDGSDQRHSRDEIMDDLKQWKNDWENEQCTKNFQYKSDVVSLNGSSDGRFGQRPHPSNKESDASRDSDVQEQDALQDALSEDNDEGSESVELKLAVSNYEITYDVDEGENANIFERLQESYKESKQRSDSLSLLGTNGSGSDGSMSSVFPVDESLLHGNKQTVEVPRRRRSTSDLHLRGLLHALLSMTEEGKKNLSSSASSDSSEGMSSDLVRRRSGSLPHVLEFKQIATMNKQRDGSKAEEIKETTDMEDDSSIKLSEIGHCEKTSPDNPKLPPNEIASKVLKRRKSMSVFEGARTRIPHDPVATRNGELVPEVPSSIEKTSSLENRVKEGFGKKPLESKSLVKALGQKMMASIRRRNSIASLKPWTGIVESSLRSSFPIPSGEENKEETEDDSQHLPRKNAVEDEPQLSFSGDHKNRKEDDLKILQGETVLDLTTSDIGNCTSFELKPQTTTKSAFMQVNKRHGADNENDLKPVQRILPKSDQHAEKHSPNLVARDKSQSKVSPFSRSRSSSIKETPVSKPKEVAKSLPSKDHTVRQESPKLECNKEVPIGRTSSNSLPRASSLNRQESPSTNKSIKQNASSVRRVKESFDIEERPARTSSHSNCRPPSTSSAIKQEGMKTEKGKVHAKSTSNRAPSPSTVSKTNKDKQQNSTLKSSYTKLTKTSLNRPPSPSNVTKAHQGAKHELSTSISKSSKGTLANTPVNRPPSPSNVTKAHQGAKHEISTSISKSGKGTLTNIPVNRPPNPSNITKAHQGAKHEISTSISKSGKGTLTNTPVNRPPSPSAVARKNQNMKQESSSTISAKGTLDKKTPTKMASNRPPSPSAVARKNQNMKQESSSTISAKRTLDKKTPTKMASNRPPSPSAFTKTNQRTRKGSFSTFSEKIDDGQFSDNTASKPSQSAFTQTVKNNTNSPQVTRKAGASSMLREGNEVPPNVSNKPNAHETPTRDSVIAEKEDRVRVLESMAAEVDKANNNDARNVNSEEVPQKQETNKEEKPTERVSEREENAHKSEKLDKVAIAEVSKIIPAGKNAKTRERNTFVNVIRRPLSASLCISVPAIPSVKIDEENQDQDKKPNVFSSNTSSGKSSSDNKTCQERSSNQARVEQNLDEGIEKELNSFGSLLEGFEKYPPLATTRSNVNLATSENAFDNGANKISNEAIPTNKRFAALSERYNAIMAKFGMLTKPSLTVDPTASALPVTSPASESNVPRKHEISSPVSTDSTKARDCILPNSENRVWNVGYRSPVSGTDDGGKVGNTLVLPEYNLDVRLKEVSDTVIGKEKSSVAILEKISDEASLAQPKNKATIPVSEDNAKNEVKFAESNEANRESLPLFEHEPRENELSVPVFEERPSKGIGTIDNHDLHYTSSDGIRTRTALTSPCLTENEVKETANKSSLSVTPVPIKAELLHSNQGSSDIAISKAHQEKYTKFENNQREGILKASIMNEESFAGPAQHTAGFIASEGINDGNGFSRTTVIASLMDRKLGPRRRTSIVPTVAVRKSMVFDDSEVGIKGIPLTIEHFNRSRDYIEKVTLKSTVKTEAMSIYEILNSLDSSLMEMELIALCKECTKTLRTLDALGSLPSYLSPNTVIVNPSGTVKFKHLNTDVTIDELLLAPEHSKKFSSEKTCVFSLAATIWLATDWKLTEHNKPALSRKFQELLISMTTDSSKERASLDYILQTCESLRRSDNEMTSRERCQALLWECQATKDLHKQNVDKKAIEEAEKTKAQHAILMGSVCVAANIKGFLKQTQSPAEAKNVQDTNAGEIQNNSLEEERSRKNSIEQEIDHNKGKEPNARAPSPAAGSMFSHFHNPADASMMFSPVSGNPTSNHQLSFPGSQSQTSTPTFVPIAVPVPTTGPPPVWYMTPSGMVPFGPLGHPPGYFVPINQGSSSYAVSDEVTPKEIERNSRPSTPKSSVSKTTRDVSANTKSKIPRPIRGPNRRSSRPPNSHQPRNEPKSLPATGPCEELQVRGSKIDETCTSSIRETSTTSHKHGGTTTSLYRSHTPPVKLRSGSVELERRDLIKPRPRSSTGSLVSTPSSGERVSRPSSPVSHSNRSDKSRPSSPSFSEGRSGSRPSSPLGSRSSSPVAALISRFEDLSTENQASEYSQSVSNLLTKFGSSSLLPEDRLTKNHFKTSTPQTREHYYHRRSGPFRPTSAADHLSEKSTQRQPRQIDASSQNIDDSPSTTNLSNKETVPKTRSRSSSSLENLSDNRQSAEGYSTRKNRERSWSSMENLHKASYEEQVTGYRIKKFSSAENLNQVYADIDAGSKDHEILSVTSQGLRKSTKANSYDDFSYASGEGMAKYDVALFRPLPLEGPSAHSQDLNVSRRETAGGSILKSTVMKAERDYQQDYTKGAVSSSARSRFEIPVALAVMDSDRESVGSSAFFPSLFSPSSAVKDQAFFQHPIKLEKENAPLSPPVPLSPSVKDCRPTSYFSSLSFTDLAMKPEKDTALDGNKKSDGGHSSRATSYQVNPDVVPIGHHDKSRKPDKIELVGTNSNVEKLTFNKDDSHAKDGDKGISSRNSSLNANDYLERFQKRLTKTNSLENIKQDMEGLISSLTRNNSKLKIFEDNAPSAKSSLAVKESLRKFSNDSTGNPLEKAKNVHQEKGSLSFASQSVRPGKNFQAETKTKQINKERSPSDTGAQGKSASNKTQQTSKSGIDNSGASSKTPSVTSPQGNGPPKPSSVPSSPTSGNPKYSKYFSYTRRQSSPHIAPSSEESHPHCLHDIRNETSGKYDGSGSSKYQERNIKESSKPKNPARPSTNYQATGSHQYSVAAEQDTFDFGACSAFRNNQLNRNMRHKGSRKTQSILLSVEHLLSNKTLITDTRTDSYDLTSSKSEDASQLISRSPTSTTSSCDSNSSSPSPKLPLNKSEQLNNSGQKGFVITDTSRQRNKINDRYPQKASSAGTEVQKKEAMKTLDKSNNFEHSPSLATKLDAEETKSLKTGFKKKVTKPATTADDVNIGKLSSVTIQTHKYDHTNVSLEHDDQQKQEQRNEKHLEKRTRHYSGRSEEVKQSPTCKERNTTSVGEGEVSGERRRSIELRQIYNSTRRASLTPQLDTTSPETSPNHSTTSRPNSALDKRPPSPGRLDSKELLGHFVKKMLNSANTTKSGNSSPSSPFTQRTCNQSKESSNTDMLGKCVSSPRERKKSSENRDKEKRESLERKQEDERKERKLYHQGEQQLERKASTDQEQRHDDQGRITATRQRKVSHEMVEQHGDQRRTDVRRERKEIKGSHERTERHGDQRRIDAARDRNASHEKEQHHDYQRTAAVGERKTSYEERLRNNQGANDPARGRRNPYERKQKYEELERIDAKIDRKISGETEQQIERVEAVDLENRLSHERDKPPISRKVEEIPFLALNKEVLQTQQESLVTPRETDDVLSKLIDMIHDEFAFDGYLDDGVEDVNMGEYVMSLSGMNEDMFKESVRDQYSDLYWDDDLLQDMYILVNKKLTSRRPTLRFSESIASDVSRPGSSQSMESNLDTSHLATRSVSRTSSERSFQETRDYVMSSLGEPTQFLPFKMICPEITRDIIEELAPVFEDYQKEMKIKLAPSISELMDKLGAKILEIGQQLTLERRAKKKNISSFNKVADIEHRKDVKDLAGKLLQEIEESDKTIIYLKYIQRRLRNIYAERFGLDHSLLYSFASSYSITNVSLEPKRQNNLLSFSPLWDQRSNQLSEAHGESTRGPVLQYGTTQGMFSYLFARHSMSQVFVRFFLYTFRYCATPGELFGFILDKCRASLRAETGSDKTYHHQLQIRYRGLDLLAEWIDCCFQFDFKTEPRLLQKLFAFLEQELIPVDKTDRGKMLVELITEKQRKDKEEHIEETSDTLAVLQTEDNQGSILEKDSPRKFPIKRKKSPVQCFKRGSPQASSTYNAKVYLKAMSVIDHSSRTIAEQLTLIQQDVFARVHSIHFLNSRTLGIGVGRLSPTKESTQLDNMLGFSAGRRRSITSDTLNSSDSSNSTPSPRTSGESNLFLCQPVMDGCLEALLMHAQDVSMWVAVEICSAPSIKNQLVLIQKYISIAKYCAEMRNLATSVQIVDALEMFVIRQLPVWKQVPNKVIQSLEELKAIKVLLKTDSSWLLKDNAYREKPTIPCALLFLMHIQQLELGGFTLANGMYKWTKMRSIARLVDQIRLFKQMRYAFESSEALKDRLRMRIQECRDENLHALAAENAANFHLSSSQSSRKFQEAFKKMKATFGNG